MHRQELALSDDFRHRMHRMARFYPYSRAEPGTLPALKMGGVWAFLYLHRDGKVRVAIHLDEAHRKLTVPTAAGRVIPLTITVGDHTVYDS